MSRILVIEDEPGIRALLTRLLDTAGHATTGAATGGDGLQLALGDDFDLVVLDLNLPDLSGEEVLRVLLAARPDSRIIVLSSATEIGRRVSVLHNGAADFVPKPFVNAELLARIRLRIRSEPAQATPTPADIVIDRVIRLDVHRQELVIRGERVPLSQREFTLLNHLLRRRGDVCTRQELLADVWGIGFDPGTNVVDVYVRRLRAKLADDVIETVRNVGYRLAAS